MPHTVTGVGYRNTDTSKAAAEGIEHDEKNTELQTKILVTLREFGWQTADELAARLREDRLTIRPRVCELSQSDQIIDTGARRKNHSGRRAIVWALAA